MAAKKKTATTATVKTQNKIPEEVAKTIMDPNASTAEKLNVLHSLADNLPKQKNEKEAPAIQVPVQTIQEAPPIQMPTQEMQAAPFVQAPTPIIEEAPASEKRDNQSQNSENAKESHDPEQEPEKELEPITKDTSCPFEATVSVALAVLRKNIGLGTNEMLKPVATLNQGAKVTVTAVKDGECLLRNGLWIAAEYLTK